MRHIVALGALTALATLLSGCGEDGKGLPGDQCLDPLPLYHYEFHDAGHEWVALHADRTPLTKAEQDAITASTSPPGGGRRCQTPAGKAKTLDGG